MIKIRRNFFEVIPDSYKILEMSMRKCLLKKETLGDKIFRWLAFGVIVSILPFLYVRFRNWLFDSESLELNFVLDLVLITFAISANAVNLLWDSEKRIKK